MALERKPYVGITGFTHRTQISRLLVEIGQSLFGDYQLMVGILVSSKTKQGLTNKWPGRYPVVTADLADLFIHNPNCLNIVHFNTDSPELLAGDLLEIAKLAGRHCHGFQLNIDHPDHKQLEQIQSVQPWRIILQINSRIMAEYEDDLEKVIRYIASYRGLITDVLFDLSGGEGKPIDQARAYRFLEYFYTAFSSDQLGCGIAGGLNAARLLEIQPLLESFCPINIDAEGQLMTPDNDPAHKTINLCRTYAYLTNGLVLCNKFARRNRGKQPYWSCTMRSSESQS